MYRAISTFGRWSSIVVSDGTSFRSIFDRMIPVLTLSSVYYADRV